MADYTVIVDDTNGQITYGPGEFLWESVNSSDHAYRGTFHNALSQDAILTFNFFGDREVVVRGNFEGAVASDNATYPIFQIDTENFNCSPNPPQNGGQFSCFSPLPLTTANHTLSMFANPNAATQQFHIDYILYGSSSQAAQAASGTVVNVQAPDNSTPGLSFDGQWDKVKLGDANDVKNAMQTSTPSTATYHFVGDSFAWWGCCMPTGTSGNAAFVTYSIDGGDIIPIQIDGQFLQGPQCINENILFQTQPGQLDTGNHSLEVVYNGDDTRMPLTLCSLAAAPVDFSILDVQALSSEPNHQTHFPSPTLSHSATPSSAPFGGNADSHPGEISNPRSTTGIIAGIISGVAVAVIIIVVGIIWWRRMRSKRRAQEKRSSSLDSLLPFVFHPVVGFIDMDKRASTAVPSFASSSSSLPAPAIVQNDMPAATPVSHEQDEHNSPRSTEIPSSSSPLESRPPSYRTTGSLLNS